MRVFLDTEFTDWDEPNLLAIGLVSDDGDELYVELALDTDDARDRMRVTSAFVHELVLPQWGRVSGAACSHREMGRRAGEWLQCRAERSGQLELVSDCRLDVELLKGALKHARVLHVMSKVGSRIVVAGVDGHPDARALFERIALERGLQRHHALADALALRAVHSGNRAAMELSAMRDRLGITAEAARATIDHLTADSESAKAAWIRDGLLVRGVQLAEAWGCSIQTLEEARNRGELFSLQFQGRLWYPGAMTSVSPADAGQVSTVLQRLDAVSQVIFLDQRHGSLGGFTTAEAIAAGKLAIVVRLAHAFALE